MAKIKTTSKIKAKPKPKVIKNTIKKGLPVTLFFTLPVVALCAAPFAILLTMSLMEHDQGLLVALASMVFEPGVSEAAAEPAQRQLRFLFILVILLLLAVLCAYAAVVFAGSAPHRARYVAVAGGALAGFWTAGGITGGLERLLPAALLAACFALAGAGAMRFVFWVHQRRYRDSLPPYADSRHVLWHYSLMTYCGAVFCFLILPILVVLPLSFNAEDFFTFTPEMLNLDPTGFSLKHYQDFFTNNEWQRSLRNSLIIAPVATFIAMTFGTLAAVGLSQPAMPGRRFIMAMLISPMIVPVIISATGMFFFYSAVGNWLEGSFGLSQNFVGYVKVVLAHAVLGVPFVIITVTATLVGFNRSLLRAAASMGASPLTTFFRVQMPLILPGVLSGGLFAFFTSFDEVVVVLFIGSAGQKTLPWQMFTGLREQISPTILAAATILILFSLAFLTTIELLTRRSERLQETETI